MRGVPILIVAAAFSIWQDPDVQGKETGLNGLEPFADQFRRAVYKARHTDLSDLARKKIVLVTITDDSFDSGHLPRLPLPRNYHARVIDYLKQAGARLIAFDFYFDLNRSEDVALARAARRAGNVVWGCSLEPSPVFPTERLRRASDRVGHLNVFSRTGDELDSIKAVIFHEGKPVPSLALASVMAVHDIPQRRLRLTAPPAHKGVLLVEGIRLHLEEGGAMAINYAGRPDQGETFTEIPYETCYEASFDPKAGGADDLIARAIRDRVVLIGVAMTNQDRQSTPEGEMWGVEIHGHAIFTLLNENFIPSVPLWANLISVVALASLGFVIAGFLQLRFAALALLLLAATFVAFDVALYVERGLALRLVPPMAALTMVSFGTLLERGLLEQREQRRYRGLLERYVSPQVAFHISEHPEGYVLGGSLVTATVLFSDIRGFTTISERGKRSPKVIVGKLNEYFEEMTECVFRNGGALDKYIGDAIMALFGVPDPCEDHARRAVTTALDMQEALMSLRSRWEAPWNELDIGIGINTGEMVVGNIGSQRRLDYTVIGDAVNTASRIEGLNKELGTRILITLSTYAQVRDMIEVRGPFTRSVKGREEEVIVFEVLGWQKPSAREAEPAPC